MMARKTKTCITKFLKINKETNALNSDDNLPRRSFSTDKNKHSVSKTNERDKKQLFSA